MVTEAQRAGLALGRQTREQMAQQAWDELEGRAKPHPSAQKLLDFIKDYRAIHHYSPSTREMKEACGFSGTNQVTLHLMRLKELRLVTYEHGVHRSVLPT